MKSIFFKLFIFFFILFFILIFSVIYDLAKYDPSYINRKSVTFNINNLNSKKIIKVFNYINNFYNNFSINYSNKNRDYWTLESKLQRENLPKKKIIYKKKKGFVDGKKIEEVEKNYSNWTRSHGGHSSSRFSSLDIINKSNIKNLELAWVYNSKDGKKGIQANPIVYDGRIYLPTPGNHIVCIDGATGKEIWRYKVEKGYNAAKRGLLIWKDTKNNIDKLFFTNDDQLISLNAQNGLPIKNFGKNGVINIGSSSVTPVIVDNKIIVATFRPSLEAYNIFSGKLYWKYYLREIDKKIFKSKDFKGGNPWGGISADIKKGIVFVTTGNPKPNYVGVLRPGKNLFSNSLIAFDVRNKRKLWHFQETCHDIWNFDIPSPPILTTINKNNTRIDVVVAVTKLGNTIILDRYDGKPIFDYEMRLAPTSLIPGEKTCPYQPSLKLPEPFARNEFKIDDVTNISKSGKEYILSIVKKSKYGFFATHEIGKDTIQYGDNGGAQWTGASIDPYKNIMYVTANNIAWSVGVKKYVKTKNNIFIDKRAKPLRDLEGYPGTKPPWGTLTSINLNSGKILWQSPLGYYKKLKEKGIITGTENFGGATATSGGLVFVGGTIDKLFRAFDSDNGEELWSYKLPFIASAPPTSYKVKEDQYVIVPATGGTTLKIFYGDKIELGDALVAFKIKK